MIVLHCRFQFKLKYFFMFLFFSGDSGRGELNRKNICIKHIVNYYCYILPLQILPFFSSFVQLNRFLKIKE